MKKELPSSIWFPAYYNASCFVRYYVMMKEKNNDESSYK